MTKLRVYLLPNADGVNQCVVAAANQRQACYAMHSSVGHFQSYGGRRLSEGDDGYAEAIGSPGTLFWKRIQTCLSDADRGGWRKG